MTKFQRHLKENSTTKRAVVSVFSNLFDFAAWHVEYSSIP